jgi:protein SCO1/2
VSAREAAGAERSAMRRRLVMLSLVLLLAAPPAGWSRPPEFQGQVLDPPRPARDFALRDQSGRLVRLSALQGQVVVLTFLYTTCPDVCPLITGKLHEVTDLLGDRRKKVAVVAVTVDPEGDTTAAVTAYSRRWAMLDRWRYLTGTPRQLQPIWEYYWVGQVRRELPGSTPGHAHYGIGHNSPIHLLDRAGRVRVVFDADFQPAAMAHDIEALLEQ